MSVFLLFASSTGECTKRGVTLIERVISGLAVRRRRQNIFLRPKDSTFYEMFIAEATSTCLELLQAHRRLLSLSSLPFSSPPLSHAFFCFTSSLSHCVLLIHFLQSSFCSHHNLLHSQLTFLPSILPLPFSLPPFLLITLLSVNFFYYFFCIPRAS